MNGGEITYHFKSDTKSFDKDINGIEKKVSSTGATIKNIVAGLGITSLVSSAMNSITSSLDGAIKRVDTLNNFPKVMELFGVTSDEASKSIKRIDKAVQGLPTPLNQAVAGVQDLFTVTQDLKKSEEMFRAVNDAAMVFAGGSTDAIDRFIYAYKQALSAGKIQAEDFNQMNEAIPGLMAKVADAMGITYAELKSGLSDGTISIDAFNNTLKKLDSEGSGSMASLQQSAQEATGGIGTSLTNMKTAVTRGVGNVIQAINDKLEDNNLPNLTEMIQGATQKINDAFNTVKTAIQNIDLQKVINAFNLLAPAITAVATAWLAWKVGSKLQNIVKGIQEAKLALSLYTLEVGKSNVAQGAFNGALKAHEVIIGLLTGKIKLAQLASAGLSKAQTVLNTVLKSNPIGIIVTAITLLVASFIHLWNTSESFRNFWIGLWEGIKTTFSNVINGIVNFVTQTIPQTISNIINWFANLPNKIVELFNKIINAIVNFINKIPGYLGFIIGYVAGFLITLPSRILEGLVIILKHLANFATSAWTWVTTEVPKIINGIVNFFSQLPSKIWNFITSTASNLWNGLVNMKNKAVSGAKAVFNAIVSKLKELPSNLLNIGQNIVKGLWNGINGMISWVTKKVKEFAKGIVKGLKSALGIHSPSKLTYEMGVFMDKGFINGMDDMQPQIQKQIDGMFNLSPSLYGNATSNLSPNVNVINNISVEQDPLGQMVQKIKTFSGGAKNDYNYGMGV